MSEEKIPTAEELIVETLARPIGHPGDYLIPTELVMTFMREFAKLHVTVALKAASEFADGDDIEENRDQIINSYPSENIK
jgi:hypothetical protein